MAVDPLFAQWLQAECQWCSAEEAHTLSIWGATALASERQTTIASDSDASAEAARQLAFLGPVSAIDTHLLVGEWRGYRGQVVTLTNDRLGYEAGADVMVLAAEDNFLTGLSLVTVLRRM